MLEKSLRYSHRGSRSAKRVEARSLRCDNRAESLFDQPVRKPDIPKQFGRNIEKSFDQPLAHRADPLSSYQAGDRALKSGKLKGQVQAVLQCFMSLTVL
jgi:hypothetical protein